MYLMLRFTLSIYLLDYLSPPEQPLLHRPERHIQYPTQEERYLKPDIPSFLPNRSNIPDLRHARHDKTHTDDPCAKRGDARW